jgi:hypothetical protein
MIDVSNKNNMNLTALSLMKSIFVIHIVLSNDEKIIFHSEAQKGISVWNVENVTAPIRIRFLPSDQQTSKTTVLSYITSQYLIIGGFFGSFAYVYNITDSDPKNYQLVF